MSKIKVLDQGTINKIAAGEVIERPASVVKELLENAIDAKATAITVEIKDGGCSFIRITDNGSGFEKEDIPTAFLRHATSKIRTIEDLLSVSSLGFRGEALSSVAAVSQVELITKTAASFQAIRYAIEGGKETAFEEIGAPDGTTIIVRNLFYNTPARRKFLKSFQTEAGYIADVVSRIALSHCEISIRFINNNQTKIHTSGNQNLKDAIYNIYGREITSSLIPIDVKNDFMQIHGYVAQPIVCRGNRTYENYFINGRYIKSKVINKAIEEGYHGFLMQHKYPFTVFQILIEQELLDVNVHPQKMEVRFRNQEQVYPFVLESVHNVLLHKERIPDVTISEEKTSAKEESSIKAKTTSFEENSLTKKEESLKKEPAMEAHRLEESQKAIESEKRIEKKERLPEPFEYRREKNEEQKIKEEIPEYRKEIPQNVKQETLFQDEFLTPKAKKYHRIIGQVFETYWIVEYEDKMFLIDQHAAHEKVLYEKFTKMIFNDTVSKQAVNPPIILSLSMQEENLLKLNLEYLDHLGFEIEPFGGQEYAVYSIPTALPTINKKELLIELIDQLSEDTKGASSQTVLDKIASMSCKAAVKGNNKLSYQEAEELIDQLLELENPYNCPHGRPVIIAMSKYELEKKFKRIV